MKNTADLPLPEGRNLIAIGEPFGAEEEGQLASPRRGGISLAVGATYGIATQISRSDPEGVEYATLSGWEELFSLPRCPVGSTYG